MCHYFMPLPWFRITDVIKKSVCVQVQHLKSGKTYSVLLLRHWRLTNNVFCMTRTGIYHGVQLCDTQQARTWNCRGFSDNIAVANCKSVNEETVTWTLSQWHSGFQTSLGGQPPRYAPPMAPGLQWKPAAAALSQAGRARSTNTRHPAGRTHCLSTECTLQTSDRHQTSDSIIA